MKYLVAGLLMLGWLQSGPTVAQQPITFENVAAAAGVDVHAHQRSKSGQVSRRDDGLGWRVVRLRQRRLLDLFLVDGGSVADAAVNARARHRLYRNVGKGRSRT